MRKDQKLISMLRAEQIKIAELKLVLTRLQKGKLEFDFFGITSNGIDCIYFCSGRQRFMQLNLKIMIEETTAVA